MDAMDYQKRQALFRAHAVAVIDGDDAETDRLQRLIWPEHLLAHQVFALALFATCVNDHFGDDLDWAVLDMLLERVRRTAPNVSPLKTEALIRVFYDEPQLLGEIPQSEQLASIWAVCRLIIGPERDERELVDLFERSDDLGRSVVREAFTWAPAHAWPGEAPGCAEEEEKKQNEEAGAE